jgi:hypothetical protein
MASSGGSNLFMDILEHSGTVAEKLLDQQHQVIALVSRVWPIHPRTAGPAGAAYHARAPRES